MQGLKISPRFETEKLEDIELKRTVLRSVRDEDGKHLRFEPEVEVITEGYMVYFPQGHSLFLTEDEVKRQGFDKDPTLIDLNSGEDIPDNFLSLKSRVQGKTRNVRVV